MAWLGKCVVALVLSGVSVWAHAQAASAPTAPKPLSVEDFLRPPRLRARRCRAMVSISQ